MNPLRLPSLAAMGIIRLYRLTISRILPPTCRFSPSCSQYGYEALQRFGLIRGTLLGGWRVLRCSPLTPGGFDPVPETFLFPSWKAGYSAPE